MENEEEQEENELPDAPMVMKCKDSKPPTTWRDSNRGGCCYPGCLRDRCPAECPDQVESCCNDCAAACVTCMRSDHPPPPTPSCDLDSFVVGLLVGLALGER